MIQLSFVLCTLLLGRFAASAPAASSAAVSVSSAPVSATAASSAVVSVSSAPVSATAASSAVVSASTAASATSVEQASGTSTGIDATATVPFASTDPNGPLWGPDSDPSVPVPQRNQLGASILGPSNPPVELQNPDLLAPPSSDHGAVDNAKWPFALSHNRMQTGGWARQENVGVMPIAQKMASVNMRLEAGAVRELHWHKTSEWAYVLKGRTQLTAVDSQGRNFVGTAGPGDLWFFPPGVPHSLQATDDDPDGSEFILVFDDGAFSEDATFLLTDWLTHVPAEVIQKNFRPTNTKAFDHIPAQELYIFPATPPSSNTAPDSPQGQVPDSYIFPLSTMNSTALNGGSVKIVDSTIFPVATTIAVAEVTVEPGAIRELHWHPTQDEWSFFIEGDGRITVFASQSNARTFNYQPGDIGYVPAAMGHYVENTGNSTLRFLEIFNTDRFQDISLNQWLALTPPDLVKAHLDLDDETISQLSKTKPVVMGQ